MKPLYAIFLSAFLSLLFCLSGSLQAQVLVQSFDTLSSLQEFKGTSPNLGQVDRINSNPSNEGLAIFSLGPDEKGGQHLQMNKSGRQMRHFDRETGIDNEPFLRLSFDFAVESTDREGKLGAFIIGDSLTEHSQIPGRDERWAQLGIYVDADSFYVTNEFITNIVINQSRKYIGKQRVSLFMNNSGGNLQYATPNDSMTTLGHAQIDVWVGAEFAFRNTPYLGQDSNISMVKFLLWLNDINASARLDNLVITDELDTDPLPVKLLGFELTKEREHIALQWQTDWEKNSSHFEVERSSDGVHFTAIGEVEAQGESTRLYTYRFADKEGLQQTAGQLYYRLRQVDLDGAYAYGPVRMIALASALFSMLEVGPNPFTDQFSLRLNTAVSQPLQLRMLNKQGQTIWSKSLPAAEGPGESVMKLSFASELKAGLYLLEVRTQQHREFIRLLKQ